MAEATLPHDMPARLRTVAVWHLLEEDRDVAVPAVGLADVRRSALRVQLRTHLHAELADAVSFREHRQRHHYDRVPADQFAHHGAGGARVR